MNLSLQMHRTRRFAPLHRIVAPILLLLTIGLSRIPAFAQGAGAAYVHVAAGASFSFAIQSDGTLWAWGDNAYGQLGDGTRTTRTAPVAVPTPTGAAPGSRWVRILAHDNPAPVLGLRSDNTLWQWGASQLRPVQIALAPVSPSGAALTKLVSSGAHALALYADGSLFSWGYNSLGQLGTGSLATTVAVPAPVVTPAAAAPGTVWVAIEAENNVSFGIRSDGTLWSWGGLGLYNYNPMGHPVLSSGCYTPELVPHPATASSGSRWVSVDLGEKHTLGLRSDGTLWAWGSNSDGAMGQGSGMSGSDAPLLVNVPPGAAAGTHWQQVSAGGSMSQGILTDGTLWAWGNNFSGQLGVNSSNPAEFVPLQEYNQETWTQATLGAQHAIALSRGKVLVAGNSSQGQLGLGNAPNRLYFFVRVVGLPLAATLQRLAFPTAPVFPNPAAAGTGITVAEPGSNRAEFVNSQGQVVTTSIVSDSHLDVPALAPGMYLLRLYNDSQYLSSKKLLIK